MSELRAVAQDSGYTSWYSFCISLGAGAASAAVVYYLWRYYRHIDRKNHHSSPHHDLVNDQQRRLNVRRGSSHLISAAPAVRLGDAAGNPTQRASRSTSTSQTWQHSGTDTGILHSEDQNLLHLLYSMAEDHSRRESYVHRGISCNTCNASPICGNRYKCANCIDYDICERCEPHDRHNRTHVFIKIKIPIPPLANPRNILIKPFYPGKPLQRRRPTREEMNYLKSTTYFDHCEIEALFDQYRTLCTKDRGITRDVYDQCLGPPGLEKNLVMDRLFKFYDANGDGYIDFGEFVGGLSILIKGSQEEKVRYAFEGYDLDGTGHVSRDNLRKMFKAYFYITIELVRDVVKACEEEMMANFDDTQGRPVSSLFSAPIPTDTGADPSQITKAPFPGNPGSSEDMWPVMEAMSQDAIEEMVENIFKTANVDLNERITLQQFQELTAVDSSLLAWFDALGTVF